MNEYYREAPNKVVSGADGIAYANREVGVGAVALVLFQRFRGTSISGPRTGRQPSVDRRVITFDNAGVGGSSGATPNTVAQRANDAIAFLPAMGLEPIDILGFSIGSFVAQEVALTRPDLVRRVVLASSGLRVLSACRAGHAT